MRAQRLAGLLLLLSLGGCIAPGQREALRVEAEKEWQTVPTAEDVRGWWNGDQRRIDQGLLISCQSPASQERTVSQNGVNDAVGYRQCPPLAPISPTAPLPQAWPPAQVGQRLDPRS